MDITVQTPSNGQLDSEELFHLAVIDSQAARHDDAIRKLKQAVSLSPEHARAIYLLGAEYAEIGLMERAVEAMTRAVTLDPALTTAQFQLGLIHYTMNDMDAATARWSTLDGLGQAEPMVSFKDALLMISTGRFGDAVATLERGIASPLGNAPLMADMRRVKENVEKHIADSGTGTVSSNSGTAPNQILLNNYREQSLES